MYAVIKTGGKQYRVAANDEITVEKLDAEAGDRVAFDTVLMVGTSGSVDVGSPVVEGASVAGEVVAQTRGKKVIWFKKRRRKNSRRMGGHRQDLTVVRITDILGAGAAPVAVAPEPVETNETAGAPAEAAGMAQADAPAVDDANRDADPNG